MQVFLYRWAPEWESQSEFFSRGIDVQIKFVKNEQGQVTGIVIVQNGRNIPAKKIK